MIINISDDWRIKSDAHQWILQLRKIRTATKDIAATKTTPARVEGERYTAWEDKNYLRNIGAALVRAKELILRYSDIEASLEDLSPLLELMKQIDDKLAIVVEQLNAKGLEIK